MTDQPIPASQIDPRHRCDGSDDPRERCGLHHATGLAAIGGYECCCGGVWFGRGDRCQTGATTGTPVDIRARVYEVLAYTVTDAPHDIDMHTDAVMTLVKVDRRTVAEEIAQAIMGSICGPMEQCAHRDCPDCVRYVQAQTDAIIARQIGDRRG